MSTNEEVLIRVDDVDYRVPAGRTILQALDDIGVLMTRGGVAIPHYCWHPKLSIDGSCRLCQVEVLGADGKPQPKLQIACNTPVSDGMVIATKSERVKKAREGVMELLLINHPLDCPICDQAGECKLQDYAVTYGLQHARTREPRRAAKKRVDLGPTIVFDQERCILCRRCVRFCREITHTGEIGIFGRGDESRIETFPGTRLENDYSMNVADICPVGALTTKDFRFKMRVWFLDDKASICTGCSRGCNVWAGVAKNEVQRYVPRRNDAVNETWMCDHGRLGYKAIASPDRLSQCWVREEGGLVPTSVDAAVDAAAERLRTLLDAKSPGVLAAVASAHASNEDLALFRRFVDALGIDLTGLALVTGQADELLLTAERAANPEGARALGFGSLDPVLERLQGGGLEGMIVLGHDLVPALGGTEVLEGLELLVVLDTHRSALERVAHVLLPVRHAGEKDGASYTNCTGIVQRVERAVLPEPDVLDEGEFLVRIGAALGLPGFETSPGAEPPLVRQAGARR